jgi:hypothetical protein
VVTLLLVLLGSWAFAVQVSRLATLSVRIIDAETGDPTPARVRLQGANGERPRAVGAAMLSETAIPIPKQAEHRCAGALDTPRSLAGKDDVENHEVECRLPRALHGRDAVLRQLHGVALE